MNVFCLCILNVPVLSFSWFVTCISFIIFSIIIIFLFLITISTKLGDPILSGTKLPIRALDPYGERTFFWGTIDVRKDSFLWTSCIKLMLNIYLPFWVLSRGVHGSGRVEEHPSLTLLEKYQCLAQAEPAHLVNGVGPGRAICHLFKLPITSCFTGFTCLGCAGASGSCRFPSLAQILEPGPIRVPKPNVGPTHEYPYFWRF